MFNFSTKNEALKIHRQHSERYNFSYSSMSEAAERLYNVRLGVVDEIVLVKEVIDSIANTPKEFGIEFGKIDAELNSFKKLKNMQKKHIAKR